MTSIVDPTAETAVKRRSETAVLIVACTATFLSFLDIAAVNLAFPAIAAELHTPTSTLTWVVSGYSIAFASLLAAAGRMSDTIGHRQILIGGVIGFAVASLACAMAPSVGWLIAGRVVQGGAGALVLPAALGALLSSRAPHRISAAIGAWTATGALATALGPALGAVIVDWWGWRGVFALNLPVCALLVVAGFAALPRTSRRGAGVPDIAGVVLLSGGVAAVVAGITNSSAWGFGALPVIGLIGGGSIGIGVALWRSTSHPRPALEVSLWRSPRFAFTNAISVCFGFGLFAYLLVMPIFLTEVWSLTLLQAAACLSGAAVAAMVAAGVVGRYTTDSNAASIAVGGLTLMTLAFAAIATCFGIHRVWSLWSGVAVVAGIGVGLTVTALSVLTASNVPPTSYASGIGLTTTSRQIGGAVGVAVMGAVVSVSGAGFIDTFHQLFVILVGVTGLGAVVAMLLPAAFVTGHATEGA